MNRQVTAYKLYNEIMELHGADEFKEKVRLLRVFQKNRVKYSAEYVTIPNYLWIARRGGGVSTCIDAFAEYLYAENIIEFNGLVKYFEFKLAYIATGEFFSELTRLNNTISEIAGHHRYYRGLACLHIDEWQGHANEEYFYKTLDYLASKNDKIKVVFCINTKDKRLIEGIESVIASRLRLETVLFKFPDVNELVDYIEAKYFEKQGFHLTEGAEKLLRESIRAISKGKHFHGFVTVRQLAKDILYHLLVSDIRSQKISADMLCDFSEDSAYIKRLKTFVNAKSVIGFGNGGERAR